jgi:hypothetical protein
MNNEELKTNKVKGQSFLNWLDVLSVLIIVSLGGLVPMWFGDKPYIAGGDFAMVIDRSECFLNAFCAWGEKLSTGCPTPRHVPFAVPIGLYAWLTEYLGLSLEFFLKSLLSILFVCSGLSMYYLCLALGIGRPGRFVASLFYMMNPFSLIIIWHISHGFIQLPYAFAPMVLGLYIRGLQSEKGVLTTVAGICLCWFVVTTSAYTFPPAAIMHWLPIAGYFIFYIAENRRSYEKRRRALIFTFCLLGMWCLVNGFWITPFIVSLSSSMELARNPTYQTDITVFGLTSSKLLDAIRLTGYWSLHGVYKNDWFYSYHKYFLSPITTLISFLVPILAFYPFLQKGPRDSRQLFLLCCVLAGLFFIKGPNPPLGGILSWVYLAVPAFATAFRFVFYEYGMPTYLAYSALLGFGVNSLYTVLDRRWGRNLAGGFVVTIVFALIIVLVYPFWNGKVAYRGGKNLPPVQLKIPRDYSNLKAWTASEAEDHKLFALPMTKSYNEFLLWDRDKKTGWITNGYAGSSFDHWFSEKPVVFFNTGMSFSLANIIAKQIESDPDEMDVSQLFGLMNIRYILLHNDTNWALLKDHSWQFEHNPKKISSFLDTQSGLAYERSFGQLNLYRLNDKYFLPHIYAVNDYTLAVGDSQGVKALLERGAFDKSSALIFTDDLEPKSFLEILRGRGGNNDLLFVNASEGDALMHFTRDKSLHLKLQSHCKVKFRLADTGKYEIWLKHATGDEKILLDKILLNILPDSKKPPFYEGKSDKKKKAQPATRLDTVWTKVGETLLKSGKHKIKVLTDSGEDTRYVVAIVPEDVMKLWCNEVFSMIHSSNVQYYLSVRPHRELSTFNIPSSGNYGVSARVKSVYVPTEEYIGERVNLRLCPDKDVTRGFADWEVKGVNCDYQSTLRNGSLDVTAKFSKYYREESVEVTRTFHDVSLKETPQFFLHYLLEEPYKQHIKVKFWCKTRDGSFRGVFSVSDDFDPRTLKPTGRYFSVDVYKHAKSRLPGDTKPYLEKISISLTKVKGKSFVKGAEDLSYSLRGFNMQEKPPFDIEKNIPGTYIESIAEEDFTGVLPFATDTNKKYFFYSDENLCMTASTLTIPDIVTDAYFPEVVPFGDLKRVSKLKLFARYPYTTDEDEEVAKKKIEATLHLDLNGDGKADESTLTKVVPRVGPAKGKYLIELDAYALANAAFPGATHYNLVRLEVRWLGKEYPEYAYNISTSRARIWKRLRGDVCDKKYLDEIISVDNIPFSYSDALSVNSKKNSLFVDLGEISLEKGNHFLTLGENVNLELQIYPLTSSVLKSAFQGLEFKKINPTKYRVSIKQVSKPFLLVFNESFDHGWKAYIKTSGRNASFDGWPVVAGSLMSKGTRHLLDRHLPINGFANGWWIPVGEKLADGYSVKDGPFEVIIEYAPQRLLEVVFLLSGISLVGCIVVVIAGRGSPRKRLR